MFRRTISFNGGSWQRSPLGVIRVNIAKKMLIGYFTLVTLIFMISAFAISRFVQLNEVNKVIVGTDIPAANMAGELIDKLVSQEFYARRCAILKSPEMLELSLQKGREFDGIIGKFRSFSGIKNVPVDLISGLHSEYTAALSEWIMNAGDRASPSVITGDIEIKKKQKELVAMIKTISSRAHKSQNENTSILSGISLSAIRVMLVLSVAAVLLSIGSTILVTRSIAGPICKLKLATRKISEGKFELVKGIKNKDEIGDLAEAFNEMSRRLRQLEKKYLDANPLTRLPGNIAIEDVLQKKIEDGSPMAFCHIDLDNFKAFNDRYGYARGSELIMATGRIVEKCAADAGAPADFVGHIGGDDFVVITTPVHFVEICKSIIDKFDRMIPSHYDAEDLRRGCIITRTRQGHETKFPIMSISIAVVTNLNRCMTNSLQVGEIAAELKEYAKSIPGSLYVVDRRGIETGGQIA